MEIKNLINLRKMGNESSSDEEEDVVLPDFDDTTFSEDEDVILPNSPLDQYLQGLNPSESSKFPKDISISEKKFQVSLIKYIRLNAFTCMVPVKAFFVALAKICVNCLICTLFVTHFIKKGTKRVRNAFSAIEKSKLLLEEDKAFLQTLRTVSNPSKLPLILKFGPELWVPFLFFSYSAVFMDLEDPKQLFLVLCITGMLLASLLGVLLWIYFYRFSKHIHCLSDDMPNVFLLFKNGIRLIQEAELISRGFTAASVTSAVERIELSKTLPINSSSRQYVKLRKCVFSHMKNLFLSYKLQTNVIICNMNLYKLSEFPSSLASLNIEEFGGLLNYDLHSPALIVITDNFSISTLKTMYELLKMQVSEFFKYAITAMLLKHEEEPEHFRALLSCAYYTDSSIKHLFKITKSTYKNVDETYCFYKSIEASYVSNREKLPREPRTVKASLEVSVHNMSLHLKAALLRLLEIEEHLAAPAEQEQIPDAVGSLLKVVDCEISAFEECFILSNKVYNNLVSPKAEPVDIVMPIKQQGENKDSSVLSISQKCDIEREIYDEVFEDVIEDTPIESDHHRSFQSEELKRNSEVSFHLMKELKNVLVVKADEHRTREEIALTKISKGHTDPVGNTSTEDKISIDHNTPVGNASTEARIPKGRTVRNESAETEISKGHTDPFENTCIETKVSKLVHLDPVGNAGADGVYHKLAGTTDTESDNENLNDYSFVNASEKQIFELKEYDATEDVRCSGPILDSSSPERHPFMSFSASIASLAAKRRKLLGFTSEEVFGSGSEDDSD